MNLGFHEFWLALTTQFWIREQPWLMASGLRVCRAAIPAHCTIETPRIHAYFGINAG